MKIEIIYTFQEKEQEICTLENLTKEDIKYKPCFIDIITSLLEEDDRNNLVKISSCIRTDKDENFYPAEWYLKSKGKFYFEDGMLIYNN